MNDPFSIFKNIKKVRVSAGMSQKTLALRLNLSDKTISAYETGRAIPPSSILMEIAKATNVSISDIMSVDQKENKGDKITDRLDKIEQRLSNLEQVLIKLMKTSK